MPRLIDADVLLDTVEDLHERTRGLPWTIKDIQAVVDKQPTVDATPVVHGRWVSLGAYSGHKCGVCEDYFTDDARNLYWCPRCGAIMTEIELLDYRRRGLPIGTPYRKTVCKHGRRTDNAGKDD